MLSGLAVSEKDNLVRLSFDAIGVVYSVRHSGSFVIITGIASRLFNFFCIHCRCSTLWTIC